MIITGVNMAGGYRIELPPPPVPEISLITDSLILHLDASNSSSYPGTGTTWTDLSASGFNATINGATWSSTDGGIFDFDGINDTVSIPHNSALSMSTSNQKTIQVWVKLDALGPTSTSQVPILGKLSSASGFDGYWAGLYGDAGAIRGVTNGLSRQTVTTSTSPNLVTTNQWFLFTFISQITATSNTTKLYVNTTEYGTNTHGSDSYGETNPFYLGYIGAGVSSLYLNGKIGACYFYNKGLSLSEITDNYDATKTRYGL